MSKEDFKNFVSKHPILIEKVKKEETSWQKLYEIYNLYEEDETAWEPYIKQPNDSNVDFENIFGSSSVVNTVSSYLKNVDMNQVQSGITNIQKVLGLVSDLFIKEGSGLDSSSNDSSYVHRATKNRLDD